jgi:hypothetical protein
MDAPTTEWAGEVEGHEVARLAWRYCELIDASADDRRPWLREVAGVLPRLQAAITSIHARDPGLGRPSAFDLDARFELFSRLHGLLADRDGYWLEFDRAGDGMTGSLADDLTDIYCELKSGLERYARSPEEALKAWASGFDRHWSRHLIDAERHLALLAAEDRLEF